ncbi:hypothetical protein CCYA_CCYA03G1021 [Cyanidiococcus yangmingshanensis]|nr:hypothetical protein CCYA_CCYA03G1021 [Cyanidiococcus yangmingshanensis]
MKKKLWSHYDPEEPALPGRTLTETSSGHREIRTRKKCVFQQFARSLFFTALFTTLSCATFLAIAGFETTRNRTLESTCAKWLAEGEALLEQRLLNQFSDSQGRDFSLDQSSPQRQDTVLFDLVEHYNSILNTVAPGRASFFGRSSRSAGRPRWAFQSRLLLPEWETGAWYLPSDGTPPVGPAVRVWKVESAKNQSVFVWTNTTAEVIYFPSRECAERNTTCKLSLVVSSSALSGECRVKAHDLGVSIQANGTANDSCLLQLQMRVILRETNVLRRKSLPSPAELAIVRPFTASQIPRLFLSLRKWDDLWAFPCASGEYSKSVDLVFYANNEETLRMARSEFPTDYLWHRCFRTIRWVEANVDPEADVHPDGTCYQFYNMFSDPRFRNHYRFVFLMEPDVHPIRAYWLDSITQMLLQGTASDHFWIRGSTSKCPGRYAFNDYHVNGNAIYNISSPEFRGFIAKVQRYFLPRGHVKFAPGCSGGYGGFDHSIFHYAVEFAMRDPAKWRVLQRLCFDDHKSPIWNFCKHEFAPWRVLAKSRGGVSLVHSSWGNGINFWDPAALGFTHLDDEMLDMLKVWRDNPFPLHPQFRSFVAQRCNRRYWSLRANRR